MTSQMLPPSLSISAKAGESSSRSSSRSRKEVDYLDTVDATPTMGDRAEARQAALSALEGMGRELQSERRSPPEQLVDPQGMLLKFIEHLLSPDHQDLDPHLTAIGYELEALLSIYSADAVKLSFPSRPPSMIGPSSSTAADPAPSASSLSASSASIGSAPMEKRSDSQQWTDAVWDTDLGFTPGERIRYEVTLPVWEEGETLEGVDKEVIPDQPPTMRVLISLPPTYPNSSPPQLQLLGRYLGSFSIDSGLFGEITRTYISSTGVPFTPGDVCVFEGLTHVQSVVREWYTAHLLVTAQGEAERKQRQVETTTTQHHLIRGMSSLDVNSDDVGDEDNFEAGGSAGSSSMKRPNTLRPTFSYSAHSGTGAATGSSHGHDGGQPSSAPDISQLKIFSSDPIVDRKSTFIGHAIRVTDEKEVPLVVHELLSDRKIAKAAHPAIFAYRIARKVGGPAGTVFDADYDDDGESAAGARLKHLIEILELENVLVVVTRWFGGIHLGPDRFKHINQAARDALELGGFLDERNDAAAGGGSGAGGKRRGKK